MSASRIRPLSTLRGGKSETVDQVASRLTRNIDALASAQNATNQAIDSRISVVEAQDVDLSNYVAKTGDQSMEGPLHVAGQIESTADGYKFPDGTVQTSAASTPHWTTAVDIDFTALSNQTLDADGTYSFGGFSWTKSGTAYEAASMAVVSGTGLVIQPDQASNYSAADVTIPRLTIQVNALIPNYKLGMPIRIWARIDGTYDANYKATFIGFHGSAHTYVHHRTAGVTYSGSYLARDVFWEGTASGTTGELVYNSNNTLQPSDVVLIMLPNGLLANHVSVFAGMNSSDAFGDDTLMDLISNYFNAGLFQTNNMFGRISDWSVVIGSKRQGAASSFSGIVRRVMVEYFG
jgi:hypothetical protein